MISCTDEQDLLIVSAHEYEILTPTTGDAVTLSADLPTNPGLSVLMGKSRLRYYTNCNSYSVEIDKTGDNFDTPVLNKFSNLFATINAETLNTAVLTRFSAIWNKVPL
jgi:hypothetical protein